MLDYLIYIAVITLCVVILFFYMRKLKKESLKVSTKIEYAIEAGLHEPVLLLALKKISLAFAMAGQHSSMRLTA